MGSTKGKGKKAKKKAAPPSFDVNASLIRHEKRYDDFLLKAAKQMAREEKEESEDERWSLRTEEASVMTREYVIAARSNPATKSKNGVKDWIPFSQLCVVRPESEEDLDEASLGAAVSCYCRELSHVAALGAPIFSTVARNDLQYAIEPVESFHKHVYDTIVEGTVTDDTMTKATARETLGLEDAADAAAVKQAYRKLSFESHPDRVEETDREAAAEKFRLVKLAYETLNSGVRNQEGVSWYESLGGRARTDFLGPIALIPMQKAEDQMTQQGLQGAVVGLDREMIQTFVARNLRSG